MKEVHFPESFIKKVKEENKILDIAKEFFHVEKMGSIYQTECIHGDVNTRSLTIYPNTDSFYCFGCHAGSKDVTGSSDVIAFVSWVEDISWQESVIYLAKRAGIPLPELNLSEEDKKLQKIYEQKRQENIRYFSNLKNDKEVLDWFLSRGMDLNDINHWRLGVDGGKPVYPIIDIMGRTCAFSKRRDPSKEGGPKYVNSKDSEVFKKGDILYGLHRVKSLIRKVKKVIVVEGYNDAIILQKFGVPAVAIMGTSLTDAQISLLKKYTGEVILFLDGDNGGNSNVPRLIDKLFEHKMKVKVVSILGMDPDEVALSKKENMMDFIEREAVLPGQYKVSKLINTYCEQQVVAGKHLVSKLIDVLETIKDPIEKEMYIDQVAYTLRVSTHSVDSLIKEAQDGDNVD